MSNTEKLAALANAAAGVRPISLGESKYRIGQAVVHVRFCSEDRRGSTKYKYNINSNTLSADFELWVWLSLQVLLDASRRPHALDLQRPEHLRRQSPPRDPSCVGRHRQSHGHLRDRRRLQVAARLLQCAGSLASD